MEDHFSPSLASTAALSDNAEEEEVLLQEGFQANSSQQSIKLHVQQPQLDPNLPPKLVRYCPSVIPIVKSKKSMVIVGAIMRSDLERTVHRLKNIIRVARKPPVVLGNFDEEEDEERNSLPYSLHPVFRTPTSHSAVIVDEDESVKYRSSSTTSSHVNTQHTTDEFAHDYLQEVRFILMKSLIYLTNANSSP